VHGFLLGLSNGTVCLATCAPLIVPYFMGEGTRVMTDFLVLALFLVGRLVGYLVFALLAGSIGVLTHPEASSLAFVFALAEILLGILMVYYGIVRPRVLCAGSVAGRLLRSTTSMWPPLFPIVAGLLTGVSLCPPFLLAITEAMSTHSLTGSVTFFLTFFIGTSIFFVPLPFIGWLRKFSAVQIVGRMTAVIVGAMYVGTGIVHLL
jgi:sulfite exporter TauE/SafE